MTQRVVSPVIHQQSTFAPGEEDRWMASAAMDRNGNIAMGYSYSSPTTHPSIVISGRQPNDVLKQMRSEKPVVIGTGSQYDSGDPSGAEDQPQWGDYTDMSVDPTFGCEFWHTNEYYLTSGGLGNTNTQIVSFRFPNCADCIGDCNLDGQVHVNELIKAIDMVLGNQPLVNCPQADASIDRIVTVGEIATATNYALNGCPTIVTDGGGASIETVNLGMFERTGYPGGTVNMLVELSGSGTTPVAGSQLDLVYDSSILSDPTCALQVSSLPTTALKTSSPTDPNTPAGMERYRVVVMDVPGLLDSDGDGQDDDGAISGSASTYGDGFLVNCQFTIDAAATIGTVTTIEAHNASVCEASGTEMLTTVTNGTVEVIAQPPTPTPGSGGGGGGGGYGFSCELEEKVQTIITNEEF